MSSPGVVFLYSPLLVVLTIVGISVPFITGHFINSLVTGKSPVFPFIVLSALLVVKAVMTPCLQRFVLSCARGLELKLQERVLDAIMDFSPAELSVFANGELVAKLTRDSYAVGGFVSGLYPRIFVAVVTMISAGFALYSRSPILGLSFMAFIPIAIVLFVPFARRFAENSHLVRQRSDATFDTLFDFFHTITFLRTLDAERRFADAPRISFNALKDGNCIMDRITVVFGALLGAILVAGEIAVLGIAGACATKGIIPVGDVIVYQLLFLTAMQSVQGIVSLLPETAALREGVDSIDEILSRPSHRRRGRRLSEFEHMTFCNVTYSYSGMETNPIINDFSAIFHAGSIVAITGANGAGKTTLLKLASAMLEPQAGEISVNGIPIEELDVGAFRRGIGIVFQDSLLVSGTVRDNITLRDPMFKETDVAEAMSLSGMDEVVKRLPCGLDTRIGLRGQSLSGGELQRLAIARALIRKPSILVLDEVTNHLDDEARVAFGSLLRRLAKGRIVLVASHDSAIINLCDEKISVGFSRITRKQVCGGRVSAALFNQNTKEKNDT